VTEQILTVKDIGIGVAWALLIISIASKRKAKFAEEPHYRYFMKNVWFKLGSGFLFACVYLFYYGGGDTIAYWQGAVNLNELFWYNPITYLEEMFSTPYPGGQYERFNTITGFPPGWIYREPESWFVSKITSVFTFITFNSYFAITFIYGYIVALASWRLFELVRTYQILPDRSAAIATLFIPTVSFWCTGISKDTLILASLLFLLHHLFSFFIKDRKVTFRTIALITFHLLILFHIRPFMIIAITPPLFLAFGVGFVRRFSDSAVLLATFRFVVILLGIVAASIFFQAQGSLGALEPDAYLNEAAIIQQDFANNTTYEGKRYDLGITDYSTAGMLKAMPVAIIAAFYRPFIWEASSAFLVLSGIESSILLWFTAQFLFTKGGFLRKFNEVRKNEFLTFAVLFALFFGFSVGFTAMLFGVLVRFKAPILPFLAVFLLSQRKKKKETKEDLVLQEE
jgi:hypothetical protein